MTHACVAHFSLDSRNENLPEKRIHRNYAGMPGRDTAPGFLLRGRDAPARGAFVRIETKERKPCSFKKVKAEIPPAGRAGHAIGRRSCCKSCWRTMARRSRARRSISQKAAIWRRFACAGTG